MLSERDRRFAARRPADAARCVAARPAPRLPRGFRPSWPARLGPCNSAAGYCGPVLVWLPPPRAGARAIRVFIGTSGYSYKAWKGRFYPEKLPEAQMLAFYARRFATVEVNNTFYRMPSAALLARWAAETPEGFTFSLKAPQRITHQKRLADVAADVSYFLEMAQALGSKLGPVLYQLPPYFKKDAARLRALLER